MGSSFSSYKIQLELHYATKLNVETLGRTECSSFKCTSASSFQLDYIWFYRYLPNGKKQLRNFKLVADQLNEYARTKIEQVKESLTVGEDQTNFISVYLQEVRKSDGKIEDRYLVFASLLKKDQQKCPAHLIT